MAINDVAGEWVYHCVSYSSWIYGSQFCVCFLYLKS